MTSGNLVTDPQLIRILDAFRAELYNSESRIKDLQDLVSDYFENHTNDANPYKAHDDFFAALGGLWLPLIDNCDFLRADTPMKVAIEMARKWENQSKRHVHKGTGYYFWGGTAMAVQNIPRAFLLFHAAFQKDRKT